MEGVQNRRGYHGCPMDRLGNCLSLRRWVSGKGFSALILQSEQLEMQKEELMLQRKELELTRDELKKSGDAQRDSALALRQQAEMLQATARLNALVARLSVYDLQIDEAKNAFQAARTGIGGAAVAEKQKIDQLMNERHTYRLLLDKLLKEFSPSTEMKPAAE